MGKGKRERAKRRDTSPTEVRLANSSGRTAEENETLIRNVLLPLAMRKGIVAGIVAARDGEVDQEQLKEVLEENPDATAYEIQLKKES